MTGFSGESTLLEGIDAFKFDEVLKPPGSTLSFGLVVRRWLGMSVAVIRRGGGLELDVPLGSADLAAAIQAVEGRDEMDDRDGLGARRTDRTGWGLHGVRRGLGGDAVYYRR